MSNSFHSDAMNLIGSYADDDSDSNSSDNNESVSTVIPVVNCSGTDTSDITGGSTPVGVNEEPVTVEKQPHKTSISEDETPVTTADVITTYEQDEVPQVGMDYTVDSDPPDESTYAQIQLVESRTDEGCVCDMTVDATVDSDQSACAPVGDMQVSTIQPGIISESTGKSLTCDSQDLNEHSIRMFGATDKVQPDQSLQVESNEQHEALRNNVKSQDLTTQVQPTLEEEIPEEEQSTPGSQQEYSTSTNSHSTVHFTSTSQSIQHVEQPIDQNSEQLNINQQPPDNADSRSGDLEQQVYSSKEGYAQHHEYYDAEYSQQQYSGYDQQYYDQEQYNQQYQYDQQYYDPQYYDQQQHHDEYAQQHGQHYVQHQQEYNQQLGADFQTPELQNEHQHYLHSDRQQRCMQPDQQQHLQMDQEQYTQPNQQQYSQPDQKQYTQSDQQQFSPPDQKQYTQSDQQQYMQPDQEQYTQPRQQQCMEPDQQQYPQPDQQQYTQPDQQQYTQPDQQQYTQPDQQQYTQPDQQQYTRPDQQQYTQPDQQQYMQQDQQQCVNSKQQQDTRLRPHGEYSDTYQQVYAAQQQQYRDQHHGEQLSHGQQYPPYDQYNQSYDCRYYDASQQYSQSGSDGDHSEGHNLEHGYHHSMQDRGHEQNAQYHHPSGERYDSSFDYRQNAPHDTDRSSQGEYYHEGYGHKNQHYHQDDPYPPPLPQQDYNQRDYGGRGGYHERPYPPRRDWGDYRSSHYERWGGTYHGERELPGESSPRLRYGSPAVDFPRDSSHASESPVSRSKTSHLHGVSAPQQGSDYRGSPQRSDRTSDDLNDPRIKRDLYGRDSGSEEKHYTKSAKYAKLSSSVVSRRPAMLKASNSSKTTKIKAKGPQIIEPHFATNSPKPKVSDKVEKTKPPVKLPEATAAKKALASFRIPKHKSAKVTSEPNTSKPTVNIPALDISEKTEEVAQSQSQKGHTKGITGVITATPGGFTCSPTASKTSPEKSTIVSQSSKSTSEKVTKPKPEKEVKTSKVPARSTAKPLSKKEQAKPLSNLDASTLQALTNIVQQTLQMVNDHVVTNVHSIWALTPVFHT